MITSTDVLHLTNRALEAAPLVPLICAWVGRHTIPLRLQLAFYYVVLEMFFYFLDVISRAVFHNNIYVYHLSTALSVVLLLLTYYRMFISSKYKQIIIIGMVFFIFTAFVDALFLNGLFVNINSYSQACGSAILIILAMLHIVDISRDETTIESQPEFFLSLSVLIYFSYTIVTCVASNIVYNSNYETATIIKLDRIISAPDALLYAVHMGLLAWMFSFFPLSINPLQALPRWLHYSRWHRQPYKVLGRSSAALHHLTVA